MLNWLLLPQLLPCLPGEGHLVPRLQRASGDAPAETGAASRCSLAAGAVDDCHKSELPAEAPAVTNCKVPPTPPLSPLLVPPPLPPSPLCRCWCQQVAGARTLSAMLFVVSRFCSVSIPLDRQQLHSRPCTAPKQGQHT